MDLLTDHYLLTVDRLFPLLDRFALKEELEVFWKDPDSVSDSWLIQPYLILALSCFSTPALSFEGILAALQPLPKDVSTRLKSHSPRDLS